MERIDDVLGYSNMKIYQNSDFFSFSLDSIILANYCSIRLRDKKVVDFCSGNAVIPLILSRRTKASICGVEIQEPLYNLANKSVKSNALENQVFLYNQDVKDFSKEHLNEFDLVVCNPPYFKVNKNSSLNLSYEKQVARHEILINLADVCFCANRVLKDNGRIALINRTERLMEILFQLRQNNMEPKRIKYIHEYLNKESYMVLIEAQKCGKEGIIVEKPLILYNDDGSLTDEYKSLQVEVRE